MNRFTLLARTPDVAVSRFDHPAGIAHRDPHDEISPGMSVNFVERGSFELILGRRRRRMTPGMLFVTWVGMAYRVRHAGDAPDDVCLSVSYSGRFAEETLEHGRGPARLRPVLGPSNRAAFLGCLLANRSADRSQAVLLESVAGELLDAVAGRDDADRGTGLWPLRGAGGARHLYRAGQVAWYAPRIRGICELLQARYDEPHTLASLGRAAGMSPLHFAHVFRELVGRPPHRYLVDLRLRRAAERLLAGASVTETCFTVGFGNLGHFIRTFRRAFGRSPSRYR
jgi:AraC-like DNA-binding protein